MKFSSYFNKGSFAITFLIDTAFVSVSITEYKKGHKPIIHSVLRENVTLPEEESRIVSLVLEAFNSIEIGLAKEIARLEKQHHIKIPRSLSRYMLSSSWTTTQTSIVSLKKDNPFIVDELLISSLLSTQKEKMDGVRLNDTNFLTLIETETVQIRLNGYETAHPYGQKSQQIDSAFWFSWIPRTLFDTLSAKVPTFTKSKKHSFPLALYSVLRNQKSDEECVIVDVGSKITEWIMVKKGVVSETLSIPFGYDSISKCIAEMLDTHQTISASLIAKSELDMTGSEIGALESSCTLWVEEMKKHIAILAQKTYVPNKFYLHTQEKYIPFFERALTCIASSGALPNVSLFCIEPVDHKLFHNQVTFIDEKHKDVGITLLTLFLKAFYD